MNTNTPLTDTKALKQRRLRATPEGLFLQESAADEVQDRLSMVNRKFNSVAIVTPFPEVWQGRFPKAHIIPDDETLNIRPDAHDLVIHAMALHWANDPVGQLIQCRRALQADGLCIAATFGGQTLQELRRAIAEAEIAVTGGLSPRIAPMGEIRDLGGLLQRAGFALPVADSLPLTVEYRNALHLMHDLRAMGETNVLNQRLRRPAPKALFDQMHANYADNFPIGENRVKATFELVFLTGWAPDASQQKPLRPGSAKHRLADALKVPETPLRD